MTEITDDAVHAQAAALIRGYAAGLNHLDLAENIADQDTIGGVLLADLDRAALDDLQARILDAAHTAVVIVGRPGGDALDGTPAGRMRAWCDTLRSTPAGQPAPTPLDLGELLTVLDEYGYLVEHLMECPALAGDDPFALATCRVCGCTDNAACDGGCTWVQDPWQGGHLCSTCFPPDPAAYPKSPDDAEVHQAVAVVQSWVDSASDDECLIELEARTLRTVVNGLARTTADLARARVSIEHLTAANIQLQTISTQTRALADTASDTVHALLSHGTYEGPPIPQELADALNGGPTVMLTPPVTVTADESADEDDDDMWTDAELVARLQSPWPEQWSDVVRVLAERVAVETADWNAGRGRFAAVDGKPREGLDPAAIIRNFGWTLTAAAETGQAAVGDDIESAGDPDHAAEWREIRDRLHQGARDLLGIADGWI